MNTPEHQFVGPLLHDRIIGVVTHSRSGVVSTASSSINRSIAKRGDTGWRYRLARRR